MATDRENNIIVAQHYYNSPLGLPSRINTAYTFNGIFESWKKRNGLHEGDLLELAPAYLGLPVTLRIPVLVINPIKEDQDSSEVMLRMIRISWYGFVPQPYDQQIRYLIHPTHHPKIYWILELEAGGSDQHQQLSLWSGEIESGKVRKETCLFTLPSTKDVESLLHCYFQLQEINKIQILDISEK